MPYTINDLRRTWAENANDYQNKEIGGIHNFINMVLQCPQLFNLKLKVKRSDTSCSYTHDTDGAPNGRPDFVIYIDKEIAIPVEAKRYTHINEGEKQLFRYQLDWCKNARYGILTDGYTWRFYNNTASRELNLDDLLNTPQKFTDFWQDYTKPEKYYLSFFDSRGQDSLLSLEDNISVEHNRGIFFDDITKLIDKFKNKLDLAGYFTDLEPKERQKKATELSYAYLIQFILYKTLVDNAYAAFSDEFALRTEQIYRALKARSYSAVLNQISGISNTISQHIYHPFSSEQSLIEQKIRNVLMLPQQEISDISLWLDIIIFIRRYDFSSIKNDIFGFIYENYLKDLYEEQQKGQYFTDPAVVNFMLDEIGFTTDYIQKEYQNFRNSKNKEMRLSLIDPSCGSGTFLYSAVDRIIDALDDNSENMSMFIKNLVNGNIFGLDIAEFPLYLAEMSILMRMLPLIVNQRYNNPVDKKIKVFKTNDSISEFMDTGIIAGDIVRAKNENQLDLFSERQNLGYQSYIRDEDDLREMKTSLQKRTRFDFVIGNPPYIGYNECCRQKALFTELIRERKMFMNNIYGINLHSIPGHPKKSPPKPNLYAFFMALGLGLLKDKAVISYIIPQTLLNAEAFDVLRYHLAKFTTIDKIITFAGNMFIGRGIHQNKPVATSSLIFVVRRKKPSARHKVKVIRYQNYDNDGSFGAYLSSERKTTASVLQSELLKKAGNWNFLQYLGNLGIIKFCQQYEKNAGLSQYYNHDEAQQEFNSAFYFDIGYNIDESNLSPQEDGFLYPKINEQFYNILQARGYYPEDRPIKLLKNNQGLKLLNSPAENHTPARWLTDMVSVCDYLAIDSYDFDKEDPTNPEKTLRTLAFWIRNYSLGKPVLVTEFGYSTGVSYYPDYKTHYHATGTEEQQHDFYAALFPRLVEENRPGGLLNGQVRCFCLWMYSDISTKKSTPARENHFGMIRLDGSRKPSFELVHREIDAIESDPQSAPSRERAREKLTDKQLGEGIAMRYGSGCDYDYLQFDTRECPSGTYTVTVKYAYPGALLIRSAGKWYRSTDEQRTHSLTVEVDGEGLQLYATGSRFPFEQRIEKIEWKRDNNTEKR